MLLGVVVCPTCRRVQVLDAAAMRARCRACDHSFELAGRKSFYRGEDPEEARRTAARVALQVGGAGIEAVAESAAAAEAERSGTLEDVLRSLGGRAEFGREEIEAEIRRLKAPVSPDRVLEVLHRESRVFEPRSGRFRWVA